MDFDLTADLSSEQLKAFDELKRRVGPEMKPEQRKDDSLFLRFLRARNYDINKSEIMLKNYIEWRKTYLIDTIVQDFEVPEAGQKYFPLSRIGFDKEGSPVCVFSFGNMDVKGLLKSVKKLDCLKTVVKYLETDVEIMKKQTKKHNKFIETWTYIFDFENYSLTQATHKGTLEILIYLFMTYEANYPERLKSAFIVNASVYFTIVFAVIKPLLSGATLKKLRIFGKDGWKPELLKEIDASVLPEYLGGKRTDPDGNPRCPSVVLPGGLVPHEYYFRSPERRLAFQPGVKKYQVSRLSKINIILDVDEVGSFIEWEFETESHDIIFGLYFKDQESVKEKPKELIPKQRVEAHLACETGMYQCDSAGTYILMFDNSYSWMQQKEIFCRASVVRPGGQKICLLD